MASDELVILLVDDDRIRDFDRLTGELFPELESGAPADPVLPALPEDFHDDEAVVGLTRQGGQPYSQLSSNAFSTATTRIGLDTKLTGITEGEDGGERFDVTGVVVHPERTDGGPFKD